MLINCACLFKSSCYFLPLLFLKWVLNQNKHPNKSFMNKLKSNDKKFALSQLIFNVIIWCKENIANNEYMTEMTWNETCNTRKWTKSYKPNKIMYYCNKLKISLSYYMFMGSYKAKTMPVFTDICDNSYLNFHVLSGLFLLLLCYNYVYSLA